MQKLNSGAFDNLHYVVGATSGNMYVCGTRNAGTQPVLAQIPMAAFGTGVVGTTFLTSGAAACSPVSEFLGSKANTTLTNQLSSGVGIKTVSVASTAGMAINDFLQIDTEIVQITAVTSSTQLAVTRRVLNQPLRPTSSAHQWRTFRIGST